MSDYSFSYHVHKAPAKPIADWMKRKKMDGIVLDVFGPWTPVYLEERAIESSVASVDADHRIVEHTSTVVRYVYQEDHNSAILIYRQQALVYRHFSEWSDRGVVVENLQGSVSEVGDLLSARSQLSVQDLTELMQIKTWPEIHERAPVKQMAKCLGLVGYEWASFSIVNEDPESVFRNTKVNAMYRVIDGRVRKTSSDYIGGKYFL